MRQRFLQSEELGTTHFTPFQDILLFFQKLDQVFLFQGVLKVIHQLGDEKMKNAAGDCIAHVHFDHVETADYILFDPLYIFDLLRNGNTSVELTLAQLTLQGPGILTLPVASSKEPQIKTEEKYRLLFRKQYHTLNHIIGLIERFD